MGKSNFRNRKNREKNSLKRILQKNSISSSFLFFVLFFVSGKSFGQNASEKKLLTYDAVYERNIKTVLLYSGDALSPPVVPIENISLTLEFDELIPTMNNYYVKIINCNADWTISSLNSIQYMNDYNEFFINDRKISVNTKVTYIHYKFQVPRVKVSGNYLLKVYRDYNEEDLILTRRFMVYENLLDIAPTVKFSTDVSERNLSQQVDFNISYPNYDIINPMQNLKVVLRQNHRWDKIISDLQPVVINEDVKSLEYFYFNRENNFKGGNEFRIIDIRSSYFSGFNISHVKRDSSKSEAFTYVEKSRAREPYAQPLLPDYDGKYRIENYETGDHENLADYTYVTFSFESSPVNGKIYIVGSMTDWRLDKNFEMVYNADKKIYTCQVLLKQGVYNYIYTFANLQTGNRDENYFEGSYSLTQNNYDIIVYYRPFGSRSDLIIGYKNINYLARR